MPQNYLQVMNSIIMCIYLIYYIYLHKKGTTISHLGKRNNNDHFSRAPAGRGYVSSLEGVCVNRERDLNVWSLVGKKSF